MARHRRHDQHPRRIRPIGREADQIAKRPGPDSLLFHPDVERLLRIEPRQALKRMQRRIDGVELAAERGREKWSERFQRHLSDPSREIQRLQQVLPEQVVELIVHLALVRFAGTFGGIVRPRSAQMPSCRQSKKRSHHRRRSGKERFCHVGVRHAMYLDASRVCQGRYWPQRDHLASQLRADAALS